MRDQLLVRPHKNTMWDLLTLQDTLKKKEEDEALRQQ